MTGLGIGRNISLWYKSVGENTLITVTTTILIMIIPKWKHHRQLQNEKEENERNGQKGYFLQLCSTVNEK